MAKWENDPIIRPATPAATEGQQQQPPPASGGGIVRNVGAGVLEGEGGVGNMLTNLSGNLVGKPLASAIIFAHDALAPVFGYERFPDKVREFLQGNEGEQNLGSKAIDTVADVTGSPKPSDVPATTAPEQIARKVAAAGTAAATLGAGAGPALSTAGPALVGAGGALVGDIAGRMVPAWAKDFTEQVGNVAGSAATSRAVTPVRTVTTPERQRLVGVAVNEGIPLTAGERTGSKPLQKTEQILGQLPGSAGGVASDVATQNAAVNRAVARRAGLDTDTLTTDVVNAHLDRVGGEIGQLATNNNMQLPTGFLQQAGQLRQNLRYMKTDVGQELGARLDQLRDMITIDPNGNPIIAGPHYQTLISDLNDAIRGAEGTAQTKLLQFRDMMRQQMEASMNPADAARWRELNRQYANTHVIRDAMGAAGAGAAEGNISLLQLRGALNRSAKDAYATGFGDLNELARVGQSVLRKPPDSGSPQGIAITGLINKLSALGSAGGAAAGSHYGGVEGAALGAIAPWAAPLAVGAVMRGRVPLTDFSPGQAYLSNRLAADVNPALTAAIIRASQQQQPPDQNRLMGPPPR